MQTGGDVNRRCGGGEAWTKGPPASLTYSVSPWDAGGAEGAGGLFLYTEAPHSVEQQLPFQKLQRLGCVFVFV